MKNKPTALYRHFDASGVLLYVGISLEPMRRLAQHGERSHWVSRIVGVKIEWLPDRAAALKAEARAIALERPRHNLQRPRAGSAAADFAERSYAVRHTRTGRMDGWYSRAEMAEQICGWFGAMFACDEFVVVSIGKGAAFPLRGKFELKQADWVKWARTKPDFTAADAFDRQRSEAAA